MKTLNDILPFILDLPNWQWFRDFEIHNWHTVMIIYENSKCRLCGVVITSGDVAYGFKGVGVLHDECFESCCSYATIRDNNLIAMQQRIFNYYKEAKSR